MQLKSTLLATAATLLSLTSAMNSNGCSVTHFSGTGGNSFSVFWQGVPSVSQSSICGAFDRNVKALAGSWGIVVRAGVDLLTLDVIDCSTSGSDMHTTVRLDKQSCSIQSDFILTMMRQTLGNAGSITGSLPCNLSGC